MTVLWKTIRKANFVLTAGDTVYIRGGIYRENNNNSCIMPVHSGAPGQYITYTNYNQEEVIITDVFLGININVGIHYIKIDGLTIDGGNEIAPNMDYWVRIFGSHNIIQNCTMRYAACNDFFQGIRVEAESHHNKILNNILHHVGEPQPPAPDDTGNAIELMGSYNLVEGNDISYSGHDLIYIPGKYNIIRNNFLHNHWGRCLSYAGVFQTNKHNVVEKNRICFATHYHDNVWPNDGMESNQAYGIIRHNLFYDNYGAGLLLYSQWVAQPSYTKVYHNVFYNNGIHPPPKVEGIGHPIRIVDLDPSGDFLGVAIKNNIFYANAYKGISWSTGTNPDDHFITNNFESGNPLFQDLPKRDFHLRPNSPCIDKGAFLTRTRSAGAGTQIPVEDAGYFINGFGIVEPDRIQLQGDKKVAKVISVDYSSHVITVDRSLTWGAGQGLTLAYNGPAPDPGAYEFGDDSTNYGVFRDGKFWLDIDWDSYADYIRAFGLPTDIPVTGDWNGDERTNYGVYRDGKFWLDTDWDF